MYLHVDVSQTPPVVDVREPDDFTGFKAVVVTAPQLWVDPAALTDLAGRAGDQEWQDKLAGMVAYAQSKGWVDERGRVRAHVEVQA